MNHTEILAGIQAVIHNGQWAEAQDLLDEYKKMNHSELHGDTLEIFQATIYINQKEYEKAERSIRNGLTHNRENYELYFMMGNLKEIYENKVQALFAYENAVFYCHNEDKEFLEEYLTNYYADNKDELSGKTAVVIVSCNCLDFLKLCLDSIKNYNLKSSYEIIVIDNASDDGTAEWLKSQNDIKYQFNKEKIERSAACNQGILLADKNSDIFIVNPDCVIMPNTLFDMRMTLYEDNKIGAVGPVSNVGKTQNIREHFSKIEEYITYSDKNNIYNRKRHELRIQLMDIAVLYKRSLLEKVGYFDENLIKMSKRKAPDITEHEYKGHSSQGNCEVDDLNLRLIQSGYKILLCWDSFIYCFGQVHCNELSKNLSQDYISKAQNNKIHFKDKWGINLSDYSQLQEDFLYLIQREENEALNILEIGCGCGALLLKIKSRFRAANVFGVELKKEAAELGSAVLNIEQGNIEDMNLKFSKNFFDYIVLGDLIEHFSQPEIILNYLKAFLKEDGRILAGIHNVQNYSVVIPLLKGNFTYQQTGILNPKHLRFYTKNELIKLLNNCNYKILNLYSKTEKADQRAEKFMEQLCSINADIDMEDFQVYKYLIEAAKN